MHMKDHPDYKYRPRRKPKTTMQQQGGGRQNAGGGVANCGFPSFPLPPYFASPSGQPTGHPMDHMSAAGYPPMPHHYFGSAFDPIHLSKLVSQANAAANNEANGGKTSPSSAAAVVSSFYSSLYNPAAMAQHNSKSSFQPTHPSHLSSLFQPAPPSFMSFGTGQHSPGSSPGETGSIPSLDLDQLRRPVSVIF